MSKNNEKCPSQFLFCPTSSSKLKYLIYMTKQILPFDRLELANVWQYFPLQKNKCHKTSSNLPFPFKLLFLYLVLVFSSLFDHLYLSHHTHRYRKSSEGEGSIVTRQWTGGKCLVLLLSLWRFQWSENVSWIKNRKDKSNWICWHLQLHYLPLYNMARSLTKHSNYY